MIGENETFDTDVIPVRIERVEIVPGKSGGKISLKFNSVAIL
jgi:hypothetical protein